jgi:alpha-ketoglutarate-dependent 2,4-dichlorophenoxyacetate dioxygenase
MDIKPCEATLGATITGVGLGEGLDNDTFGKIEAAWHQYGVLIFPGQDLSDEMHIAFSRRFGELERSLDVFRGIAEDRRVPPELIILSNVKDDGTLWPHKSEHGLFLKGNRGWHTDSSFKRVPAMDRCWQPIRCPIQVVAPNSPTCGPPMTTWRRICRLGWKTE